MMPPEGRGFESHPLRQKLLAGFEIYLRFNISWRIWYVALWQHKKGIYLDACKDCIYLHEKDWDEENYINHFTFNHWTKCNCNCIYCYTNDDKKKFNAYKEYPIFPIIKAMFKSGVIKKTEESCLCFGGGEPTILKDFDKLINLLLL